MKCRLGGQEIQSGQEWRLRGPEDKKHTAYNKRKGQFVCYSCFEKDLHREWNLNKILGCELDGPFDKGASRYEWFISHDFN